MTTRPASIDAIAAAAAKAIDGEAEQLDLLPLPSGESRAIAVEEAVKRARARGRPAGAQNIATREMVEFIRRTIGDPMLDSARWTLHTPESLATMLGCTRLEAFDRLEKIRADLRRFVYAPKAPEDADGNAVMPTLVLELGGTRLGGSLTERPPWEYLNEQNQGLSEDAGDVSHGDVSHGEGK
jgi:hypothetical protein